MTPKTYSNNFTSQISKWYGTSYDTEQILKDLPITVKRTPDTQTPTLIATNQQEKISQGLLMLIETIPIFLDNKYIVSFQL